MGKYRSKRFRSLEEIVVKDEIYSLADAITVLKSLATAKFDETVEVSLKLGINPKHSDQMVRGFAVLPNGTGKDVRVCVVCEDSKVKEAKESGADVVGSEDIIEEIKGGKIDFDILVSTPSMMPKLAKVGRILGPKGLMPNPKNSTVTLNIKSSVKNVKAGQVNFKNDKHANVHAGVGKSSFEANKLKENIDAFIAKINKSKPPSSKGRYIKSAYLSLSLSPSLAINTQELIDTR